jgi:hypothetical protein
MPSDPRSAAAVAAVQRPREAFQSAVAATLEEVRVYLDTHQSAAADRLAVLAAELGPVGARHIDVPRLAAVLTAEPAVAPATHTVLARALATLRDVASRGDEAHVVDLVTGDSLYGRVTDRLAELGRAMGAARVVDAARGGRYRPSEHDPWLVRFPFALWAQGERAVAPPIVIEVDGTDLRPAGLAEFLDGAMKIVLVVRGEASPAPLVRLVTPRTFVAQVTDERVVARLAAWNGPGIVGLMPPGSARFVHDPAGGATLAARLAVMDIPALDHRKRAGPFTVAQQREELDQLQALQSAAVAPAAPAAAAAATAAAESADPVDRLAAWLLRQADLSGV